MIHLPFSYLCWMSTNTFVRLELSEKNLSLRKHGDIILGFLVLSSPDFWMIWRCHGIPYVHFYFLFRNNLRKRYLDESDFRYCYSNAFESSILKVTCSQLCSKFFLNSCKAHWQHILKDTQPLKIVWTWIEIRANSFIKTWVNIIKQKSTLYASFSVRQT